MPKKKTVTIVVIVMILLLICGGIAVGIILWLKHRHKKPPSPPPKDCKKLGEACSPYECCSPYICDNGICKRPCIQLDSPCQKSSDCCQNLHCIDAICQPDNQHDKIDAFQFQLDEKNCLGLPAIATASPEIVSIPCDWNTQFWTWTKDNLYVNVYSKGPSGNLENINVVAVDGRVTGNGPVSYVPYTDAESGNIKLNMLGDNKATIATKSGYCAYIDTHVNQLFWKKCDEIKDPNSTVFTINKRSSEDCHIPGEECTDNCCLPFESCSKDGGISICSPCFGVPHPSESEIATCNPITHQWEYKSKCSGKPSCPPNAVGKCECTIGDPTNCKNWDWVCELKCSPSTRPHCDNEEQPTCVNSPIKHAESCDDKVKQGEYGWCCPSPCQDWKPPQFDGKCVSPDGTPFDASKCVKKSLSVGSTSYDYYECNGKCVVPKWECVDGNSGHFVCNPTCCPDGYTNLCPKGQKPVCNLQIGEWECQGSHQFPDSCGLPVDKPSCADAECVNMSNCPTKENPCAPCDDDHNITDWRWLCKSDMNKCQTMNYYDWHTIEATDESGKGQSIVVNQGDTPICAPTNKGPIVLYSKCRGGKGLACDNSKGKDVLEVVNNPSGYLIQDPITDAYILKSIAGSSGQKDATGKYIYVTGTADWPCLAPNPCYSHGTYNSQKGFPVPAPSVGGTAGPPTKDQLLESDIGSCQCQPGWGPYPNQVNDCQACANATVCPHGDICDQGDCKKDPCGPCSDTPTHCDNDGDCMKLCSCGVDYNTGKDSKHCREQIGGCQCVPFGKCAYNVS